MAVYSKRASPSERVWLAAYESTTGFEALHQDDFDEGRMSFDALAKANVRWFEDQHFEAMLAIPEVPESAASAEGAE